MAELLALARNTCPQVCLPAIVVCLVVARTERETTLVPLMFLQVDAMNSGWLALPRPGDDSFIKVVSGGDTRPPAPPGSILAIHFDADGRVIGIGTATVADITKNFSEDEARALRQRIDFVLRQLPQSPPEDGLRGIYGQGVN